MNGDWCNFFPALYTFQYDYMMQISEHDLQYFICIIISEYETMQS